MSAPYYTALSAVVAWWLFVAYQLHGMVMQGGSWYNHLKMSDMDTYPNRLQVTVTDRLNPWRTLAANVGATVAIYVVVYLLTVGVLEVVA